MRRSLQSLRCVVPAGAGREGNGPMHSPGHGLRGDLLARSCRDEPWQRMRSHYLSSLREGVPSLRRRVRQAPDGPLQGLRGRLPAMRRRVPKNGDSLREAAAAKGASRPACVRDSHAYLSIRADVVDLVCSTCSISCFRRSWPTATSDRGGRDGGASRVNRNRQPRCAAAR
jgi:hypothetical protein